MRAVPWVPAVAREFLETIVGPGTRVFEYGPGGSTLFFRALGARVVSVEHDYRSYLHMRDILSDQEGVILEYVPPGEGQMGTDNGCPEHYYSGSYPGKNFREYASAIERYKPVDLVFIDGRARPSCISHAIGKIKPGGWLFLDNSARSYYLRDTAWMLEHWECRIFFGEGPVLEAPWEARAYAAPGLVAVC